MNILLLGSGGRENALAWKINQSNLLSQLYIMPGNVGTEEFGINVNIDYNDFDLVKEFVISHKINMVISGPEDPLVNGIADFFKSQSELKDIIFIGPSMQGAKLEGSKDFAKQFMQKYDIPTAKYRTFTKSNLRDGINFLHSLKPPYVLKADGLAAGKGVLILKNINQAVDSLIEMLNGQFGKASDKVVIEEFLSGIELSVFALTDGKSYVILPEAKDYKRIGEGDTGLNTGGMGAVSPVSFADKDFMEKVEKRIIIPTINGIINENIDYTGFVFFGLIKVNNDPYVIEYNVRMGDPETEVVIPRLQTDLIELLIAAGNKKLNDQKLIFNDQFCTTVMLVSKGYPGDYEKGKEIININNITDSLMFHAGTKGKEDKVLTNGGRVLAISSFGNSMNEALLKSYKNAEIIDFEGKYYRKDIGFDL
ncbi:MAG: phosphoribosylamine--glycine ligase [Bacteroidetes bacterium GWA2_31_9]|nr:MAG: phosphoribosylamine--glycine ligase [Bacteroidetes bacterium GWA2_31_9]